MNRIVLIISIILGVHAVRAQMGDGRDTLYGNEWIRYEQLYYKIPVAADGVYRVPAASLAAAGVPVGEVAAGRYQLYHQGSEVPLYTTAGAGVALDAGGYLEFYGERNRSAFDRYLFRDPDAELLNPEYSLYTDTAAYFLTVGPAGTQGLRYRQQPNDLSDLPAPEAWCWAETTVVFSAQHLKRYERVAGFSIFYSNFDVAEGFGSRNGNDLLRVEQRVQELTLQPERLVAGGPAARLTARYACGPGEHRQVMRLNGVQRYEEAFSGFGVRTIDVTVPAAELGARPRLEFQGLVAGGQETQSLAYVRLRYPRTVDFSGQLAASFEIDGGDRRYLELAGVDVREGPPVLYDPVAGRRWSPPVAGGQARLVLPAGPEPHRLVLAAGGGVRTVSALTPLTFIDYARQPADYLILTHPDLAAGPAGQNPVQAYADYRASAAGGGFRPLVVDVRTLYDQFGYGIARHAQGLRNFAHYARRAWPGLRYLLIIGKGMEYPDVRGEAALRTAVATGNFYVPSFGYPAADHLLLATNTSSVPLVPVGRIPANNPQEVAVYLRKVEALEAQRDQPQTIAGRAWMKRVIHLGGGSQSGERELIRSSLIRMGEVLEDNAFGAGVTGFYKASNDPIQTSLSEQIFDQINEGAAMLTFFGHSSPGAFDFNIDNPDNYDNRGRTPLMLSLGCYSGNAFTAGESIGERFCFYEDKGAVAFAASRGLGFVSALYQFASEYYARLGGDDYGRGIGDALRHTFQTFDARGDLPMRTLVQQFVFLGDPAIRLHPAPGPDYVVDAASAAFEPRVVTAQQDSFTLRFDVVNLGRHDADTLTLTIEQQLPDGRRRTLRRDTLPAPAFRRTLTYALPNAGAAAVGLNTVFVTLDPDNRLAEQPAPAAEQNNALVRSSGEAGLPLFVVDNAARPVFPRHLAIVTTPQVTLKASTTDALAPERTYVLQLDTTPRFDSPTRQQTRLTQRGGVIRWSPNVAWQPGQAYFWRISPDSTNADVGFVWEQSTFTYLPGSAEGWMQGGYWQWGEGRGENIRLDPERRAFTFSENFTDLRIFNKVFEVGGERPDGYINSNRWSDFFRWEAPESINIVVFDPQGNIFWNDRPGQYGSLNKTATKEIACFPFPVETAEQRQNIIRFLDDIVAPGSTVFFYTAMRKTSDDLQVQDWAADSLSFNGKNLFNILEAQGADQIRLLANRAVPYLICYQKDNGKIFEQIAGSVEERINFEHSVRGFWDRGRYSSPLVGPARNWGEVSWRYTLTNDADSLFMTVWGIGENGEKEIVQDEIRSEKLDLSSVDPGKYPYLQFEFYAEDTVEKSVPQIDFWNILYQGFPDFAVNPAGFYQLQSDTIRQGQPFRLEMAVENLSQYPGDSLLVRYVLAGADNRETSSQTRNNPLRPGEEDRLVFSIDDTRLLTGNHQLRVEVNPGGDQPEQYTFNNVAVSRFFAGGDERNPLLDVTFDGLHIADGDLVSARPEIVVVLRDENEFLPIRDTTSIRVSVREPDGRVKPVVIDGREAIFFPAQPGERNQARLEYRPSFAVDGTYELIVNGRDASGNASGKNDYRVTFQVITARRISNVLNYPNPFSTSTQFVYTLTGDEPPAQFRIQIMTISGRIVREITESEIGPLRIGTHRTEYVWDGRDDYGDKLANGVYLYRVVARDVEGKDYETFDNGAARFFDKGFGKLVILR